MEDRTRALLPYVIVALLCGALGLYLALAQGGEAKLRRAGEDVRAGRSAQALTELDGLAGQTSGRAASLRGDAYFDQRQYARAAVAFSEAARRSPNDWTLQRDYAIVLRKLGRVAKARARMQRALALNPRMQLPLGFLPAQRPGAPRPRR